MPVRYIAQPKLLIDGQQASADLMEDILQICVEESLHLPAMFTIVVNNSQYPGRQQDQTWQHQSLFEIGKTVKINFTSSTTESRDFEEAEEGGVIEGEITAMEAHFTKDSQAPIVIRGYDVSHRLHRGRFNRSFQNITDSDIVKNIAGDAGITTGTVDSTTIVHEYVFQENQTNMEFLRERAARNGFELFVQDGKLNFRKPKVDASVDLKWLRELHSFRVRISSAEQVSTVEVRGWDYETKKPIIETASSEKVLTETDNGKGSATSTKFRGSPKMILADQPVFKSKEAKQIAQAIFDEVGGEFVFADARAEGNPEIRPGKVINLSGMGKYSGKYYVTETRHLYDGRIYSTEFSVRGLRGGNLLSILSPTSHLEPGQMLLVGIVTNNQDPKKWGRVRVKFPTLTEEHESNWARIVAPGAGPNRGADCLPEVNDEVLVAFENGDIHRPYVLGNVWNGTDAPPTPATDSVVDGKVRLRTFKTRTGHTLQFVEEDKGGSKKGFYVTTVYGHQVQCNDTDKFVELKTTNGHSARFDDQNKKVEVKTQGGHQIVLDDNGGAKVDMVSTGELNVKSGRTGAANKINLNAGEITLTATTKVTINVGASKIELTPSGITIDSVQVTVKGSAQAKLEGTATVSVESAGINTIKGSVVKIN